MPQPPAAMSGGGEYDGNHAASLIFAGPSGVAPRSRTSRGPRLLPGGRTIGASRLAFFIRGHIAHCTTALNTTSPASTMPFTCTDCGT